MPLGLPDAHTSCYAAHAPNSPASPPSSRSYTFAFKGPAVSVDTACSSSLVAAHLAAGTVFSSTTGGGLAAGAGLLLSPDTTGALVPWQPPAARRGKSRQKQPQHVCPT